MDSDRSTLFDGFLPRFLAGATFGYYVTHLAYLLNPQIDISGLRLVGIGLFYALVCGLQFGILLWLLRLARVRLFGPGDGARGFGWIVFATAFAAAAYLRHVETLRIYLPIDAVRALSNATRVVVATWLMLFVLWLVERSTPPKFARLVLVGGCGLIAVSAFFLQQRRNFYRIDKRQPVVVDVGPVAQRRPVVVVAIRSLPYDWIVTLRAEMQLPFFDRAAHHDFLTRLPPFPTTSARSIWASLASGKLPYRTGVTGLYSYRTWLNRPDEKFLVVPRGTGFGEWGLLPPVTKSSSHLPSGEALPFWSLFTRLGLDSVVMNWPESWVSPSPAGVLASDRFFLGHTGPGDIHPRSFLPELESIRKMPVGAAILGRFASLPEAQRRAIASGFRGDFAAIRAAEKLADAQHPALTVIAIDGLGDFLDVLGADNNRLPPADSPEGSAVRTYVEQIDLMLGRITEHFPNAVIVIASPSGPAPERIPHDLTELVLRHIRPPESGADDGFLVITGPGTKRTDTPPDVSVVDVVPTILFAAGLPVGRDMDGRVITEAFQDDVLRENPFTLIQSYEAPELSVRHPG